ncbi:MAG TPA: baseplate J/gp47 family protein [Longimicrobium sp.]|nr:baseplate J/gp47 family protein [Longimicrobium sp.]
MSPETVSLLVRPYREVVDDVLTALLGGVTNERISFDVKSARYSLSRPARAVRAVDGLLLAEGEGGRLEVRRHAFLPQADWEFSPADNELVWVPGGRHPADESDFDVDYVPVDARSPITDVNVGSVARTVAEAMSREIAVLWEQVNQAYRSAFLDTATGKSLDLVVSILGLARKRGEYAQGLVTFYRRPEAGGGSDVAIVEGTPLRTAKDDARFVTAELRVLQRGQARVDVPVRADEGSRGPAGAVPAGAITLLPRPLEGIERVVNLEPTLLGAPDETDEQLRARARAALRSLGTATVAALTRAAEEQRATVVEVWDPNGVPGKRCDPGTVTMIVESEPERLPQVLDAVHRARAAGVRLTLEARYVYFRPRLTAVLAGGLTPEGQLKAAEQVVAALGGYVDALGKGEPATGEGMLKALKAVRDVRDPVFVDVAAAVSDVDRPSSLELAHTVVASLGTLPPGADALASALAGALDRNAPPAPTGGRKPDRSRVVGDDGKPASDAAIEAGTFSVLARVGGEDGWVVLEMGPADVLLTRS